MSIEGNKANIQVRRTLVLVVSGPLDLKQKWLFDT